MEDVGDSVMVSLGGYARSWRAEIDFDGGIVVRKGDLAETGVRSISANKLASLRACAERAHAQGDLTVRDQFANGGCTFEITLGGTTVTLSYETEGGGHYPRVQEIFDFLDP